MIKTFEKYTKPLSEKELRIADEWAKHLLKRTKAHPIKANKIVSAYKMRGIKISGPRVRKIMNYIRTHNLIKSGVLVASSRGYYVTNDAQDIENWLESLRSRRAALDELIDYAEKHK